MVSKTVLKRFFALLFVLAFVSICFSSYAEDIPLSMTSEHPFRILVIADPQDTDRPQKAMLNIINGSLEKTNPDMVVLLGDNIHGNSVHTLEQAKTAIDYVVKPISDAGIPFALVFGNHDDAGGVNREEQMQIYTQYPGCLAIDGEDLPGCGNYYITIENKSDPSAPVVLFFLDSGSGSASGYGCVTQEQNEWMRKTADTLRATYPTLVPYVFQHIPVPKIYDLLTPVSFGTKGAITQLGNRFFQWYLPNDNMIKAGKIGEAPCPSEEDSGEFEMWKDVGIRAAFFGHDHLNDYLGTIEGIDLVSTTGCGFYIYGRNEEHGVRIIELNADHPSDYSTQMLYYHDLTDEPMPDLLTATVGALVRDIMIIVILAILVLIIVIHIFKKRRKNKK